MPAGIARASTNAQVDDCIADAAPFAPPVLRQIRAWVHAGCFGVNHQFSQHRTLLWLIDAGYPLVQLLLFALILGLWH